MVKRIATAYVICQGYVLLSILAAVLRNVEPKFEFFNELGATLYLFLPVFTHRFQVLPVGEANELRVFYLFLLQQAYSNC